MSFRFGWAFKQFFSIREFFFHRAVLKSPWKFYYFILLKLIPGLHKQAVDLTLLSGGVIRVREFMTLYIYKEIFIDRCYDGVPVESKSPLIVEIGANTGLCTLRFKECFPDSRIICFEPYPPNFEALLETIDANCLNGVVPINKAVGGEIGLIKLFIHPTNVGGHSIVDGDLKDFVEVESTTVDALLSENGVESCDIMKMDCEGAELQILRSFTRETARKVKSIIYEPTHGSYSVQELNGFLENLGYSVWSRHGLVIASMLERQG